MLYERYGVKLVLSAMPSTWKISIGESDRAILVDADPATFTRSDSELPLTGWYVERGGWRPALAKLLPAPGAASLPTPLIERVTKGYIIHYDILGLVYWMLTRQEEVGRTDLDEHGRFAAGSSHAFKHGYLERPVVDEWLDILGQVIQRTWPSIRLKRRQFSVKVSHDVDQATRYGFRSWRTLPRVVAQDVLKLHDARGLLGPWMRVSMRSRLNRLDAYNTFDWLMDTSEKHGLISAFYFICNRRGTPYDCDYDLEHPAIRSLIRRIHVRGHEVGLHASYNTYLNCAQLKLEANRLRRVCSDEGVEQQLWGGRMHWLQWSQPRTLRAWSDAGMAYDSTMTYAERPGFRCGTSCEYPAFDPVAQEVLRVRVRPLVVMEGSVIANYGLGLGAGIDARRKMLALKDSCRRVGGHFTLLWHNSNLITRNWRQLYWDVLDG